MSLNAKTIEILSVNAVKDSIAMCDFLEPFINDNDKEPSWDGDVYIYNNRTHKKENLAGRLSVQVKGKAHEGAFKSEISYSISTIDLRNFLYDGGIILFVVYIDNGGLRKIYYIELPPIKLRVALAETQNKKTKSLTLKEFPTDNNKKRKREFNISELAELYALIEDSTTREDILVGAYLLLGQQRAAEIHFSRLTPELQNSFKSYPIYRFWNENR